MVVIFRSLVFKASKVCWTIRSLVESKAEVASSRSSNEGFLRRARARATRCFWPPLNWLPPDPTKVLSPSGSFLTKSSCAALHASSKSCCVDPGEPYKMLSRIEVQNMTGSCPTNPVNLRTQRGATPAMSVPLILTDPLHGS
mmetsp:Transcript_51970/g.113980  ORF Transcript_51970/g.113980 Transcript_51970/m.113980 type:complete len:142 (-) Transcript_51970:12-437(-)